MEALQEIQSSASQLSAAHCKPRRSCDCRLQVAPLRNLPQEYSFQHRHRHCKMQTNLSSASAAAPWHHVPEKIGERSGEEGWTPTDLVAATLQASFLSYQPQADDTLDYHSHKEPQTYMYDAWKRWTPPWLSRKRTQTAAAHSSETSRGQRVRVHLSASQDVPLHASVIAFASVEKDRFGETCLSLRRGADVLACLPLLSLHCELVGERMAALLPTESQGVLPRVFLRFGDNDRLHRFCMLLRIGQGTR
jgi:hypothetical protein